MTLFILAFLTVIILLVNVFISKKIYAPPVILCAVFLACFFLIEVAYGALEDECLFYGCYVIAAIMFSVGFHLASFGVKCSSNNTKYYASFSDQWFPILILMAYGISAIQLADILPYVGTGNLWRALEHNFTSKSVIVLLNLYNVIIFFISTTLVFLDSTKKNKKRWLAVTISLIPYLVTLNRGTWIMMIITIVFQWLYIKRKSNIIAIRWGSLCIAGMLGLIAISSIWKYGEYYNYGELFAMVSKAYFGSQFVAFRLNMTYNKTLLGGQNTFRVIIAVLHSIGLLDLEPINIVQPFVTIYGYPTNVYTGLSYYAMDFGMWWAYAMEFIFGLIYGRLYKKAMSKKTVSGFYVTALSMLMYPLVNQFFDDKYLSVAAEWIKYFILLWIFTRKSILQIKEKPQE